MALTKVTYSMIEGAPFNVLDYGAAGDGVTNDTAAIQAAIDAAYAAGGGQVFLPTGTYSLGPSLLTETLWNFGVSIAASTNCLILRDNVQLIGEGIDATKLVSISPTTTIIAVSDGNNIKVSGMTLNGLWSSSGAGHGILQLLSENDNSIVCENMVFDNLFITNVGSYAIGVENGNCFNVYVNNVRTFNSGADAIDFKNRGSLQNNTGIFISNTYIEKYGRRVSLGSGQTGIDIRGVACLNNIQIKMISAVGIGHVGIRFRTASGTPPNEQWGAKSSLTNFYIYSDDTSSVNTNNAGLVIGSKDVTVTNGYIENCYLGVGIAGNVNATATNVSLTQVNVNNSSFRSFFCASNNNYPKFTACQAQNSGVGFRIEASYATFISCQAVSTTTGFSPSTGALPTAQVIGCLFNPDFGISVGQGNAPGIVAINAKGDSADIDLQLIPKGTGMLRYGVSQAITTETLSRYIEVKDQGGNIRKLAIVS